MKSSHWRQQRILTLLRDLGEVRTGELIQAFGVTGMTVWRDLRILAEQGLLQMVHGGARLPDNVAAEQDFEGKADTAATAKARIAKMAVQRFVHRGDVIGMEGGTTVAALIPCLPTAHISLVTNSLPLAMRARAERPTLPLRMIGGLMSAVSGNTTGPQTVKAWSQCPLSVCFLSAAGWDLRHGPMDPNPLEIEAKRAMAASSRKVILLMDSTKFHTVSQSVTIHPKRLHAVVTDKPLPKPVTAQLAKSGVEVVLTPARRSTSSG